MADADNGGSSLPETGIGGPESDIGNGIANASQSGDGNAGRIDPDIARRFSTGDDFAAALSEPVERSPGQSDAAPASQPRRRGRPPGSGTGASKPAGKASEARHIRASFIEMALTGIHTGIASLAKAPEFELDKDDAKKLADASANLMSFYNVTMTPKQEAFALLIQAAAMVYPPMVGAYVIRKQSEAKQRKPHAVPNNVRTMTPTPVREPPLTIVHPVKSVATPGFDPSNITIPDGA